MLYFDIKNAKLQPPTQDALLLSRYSEEQITAMNYGNYWGQKEYGLGGRRWSSSATSCKKDYDSHVQMLIKWIYSLRQFLIWHNNLCITVFNLQFTNKNVHCPRTLHIKLGKGLACFQLFPGYLQRSLHKYHVTITILILEIVRFSEICKGAKLTTEGCDSFRRSTWL